MVNVHIHVSMMKASIYDSSMSSKNNMTDADLSLFVASKKAVLHRHTVQNWLTGFAANKLLWYDSVLRTQ